MLALSTLPTIAFIGGGNMAQALIGGLLAKGHIATKLHVADTDQQKLANFAEQGIHVYDANDTQNTIQAISQAEVVIIAVKPQVVKKVLMPLQHGWQKQLVISIVAGVSYQNLSTLLGKQVSLVRAMPNTPAMIQMGATGLYASPNLSDTDKMLAYDILSVVGLTLWVENEDLLHAVTAISGSAPAYFFYLLENMIATGEHLGLTNAQATALAMQTALGSAQMALTSHENPAKLRQNVTSPNGTTQSAIDVMDNQHMNNTIQQAMLACVQRSKEISQSFD